VVHLGYVFDGISRFKAGDCVFGSRSEKFKHIGSYEKRWGLLIIGNCKLLTFTPEN